MEITFEKVGNKYVAEFEATADFNIHIERAEQGTLEVYQRGIAEGEYDFAWSAGIGARKVIDYDFAALVYPKWIKVVSGSEVLSASVNFNEGGGSGSGSGEASTIEYLDVSGLDLSSMPHTILKLEYCATAYRIVKAERLMVGPYAVMRENIDEETILKAIAIDANAQMITPESPSGSGETIKCTIKEYLIKLLGDWADIDAIPRITKEQFYNLEA